MKPTDEQIMKNVVDQLYWDSRVDASDIKIKVIDGEVSLEGTVQDYTALQAAESDVWAINGVRAVHNCLAVKSPATVGRRDDNEVKACIESTFIWDPNLDASQFSVSVKDGKAKIQGTVDAYWKKVKAEQNAFNIIGVTEVINELVVVPRENKADEVIAEDLMTALDRNIYVNSHNINIKVENGKVTLFGKVRNSLAYRTAVDTARLTPGVKEVVNNLSFE
jgi:osmotically-inducible protein OsmY